MTERRIEAKPLKKNQRLVSYINPEGTKKFAVVTVDVPELEVKKGSDGTVIIPPKQPLHLHYPSDIGDQKWQDEDG